MREVYQNNKMIIDISIGAFIPAFWKPEKGKWHVTYSIDFKFKK